MWVETQETNRPPLRGHSTVTGVDESEVEIAVRDGVILAGRVFRPVLSEPSNLPPALVVMNGYSGMDWTLLPHLRDLAIHGFAVVVVRTRGVAPSGGVGGLYERYGEDGHDVVEWAARQVWNSGRVGMVGASLLGIAQWLTAREYPDSLKVIVPDDAPSNTYDHLWYVGGLPPGPGRRGRASTPGVTNEYDQATTHRRQSEFWKRRSLSEQDLGALAKSGLPVLMSSGWDSYMLDGVTSSFTTMRRAGAGQRIKLVLGPWGHGSAFSTRNLAGGRPLSDDVRPQPGSDLQVAWLDRHLRGEGSTEPTEPPVLIWVQGPDQWRRELDWPLPDELRVKLYVGAGTSATATSLHDGRLELSPPTDPGHAEYGYRPGESANPVDVVAAPVEMQEDGPPIRRSYTLPDGLSITNGRVRGDKSAYEQQAVTWTSEPFVENLEITGRPSVSLWVTASNDEAVVVAELMHVAPDGETWTSSQITRGFGRVSTDIDPNPRRPVRLAINLSPTSYVVPAGHRVRLTVQGAPLDPALNVAWQGPGLSESAFDVSIHWGPGWPSHVDVPFIGATPR